MNHPGLFLVLEGSDGAGKTTQLKLLEARLKALGYELEVFTFPQYKNDSSYFIRQYLGGHYGPASTISPYTAAIFYAVDRYESAAKIRQALVEGKIVLADRFSGSNMAHQGSKFGSSAEKRGFFIWVESLEYELLGIPRPDKNIYLHLPIELSKKRINSRAKQTKISADEHERDDSHLINTLGTYELLCQLFPKDFVKIEAAQKAKPLDIKAVSDSIWQQVKPLLPPNPPHKAKSMVVKIASDTKPGVKKTENRPKKRRAN